MIKKAKLGFTIGHVERRSHECVLSREESDNGLNMSKVRKLAL